MDSSLRCNNLKCRKALAGRGVLTSCDHIFCIECAQHLGMISARDPRGRLECPVCKAELRGQDDATIKNLNLSELHKSFVLKGLSPDTIMECAGRAMSFWSHQMKQQACYQCHVYNSLNGKCTELEMNTEKIVREANMHVEALQKKLKAYQAEADMHHQKREELGQAYREKHRQLVQVQKLYDQAKQTNELDQIQRAALEAVESRVRETDMLAVPSHFENLNPLPQVPPFGSARRGIQQPATMNTGASRTRLMHANDTSGWPTQDAPEYREGQRTANDGHPASFAVSSANDFRPPGPKPIPAGAMNTGFDSQRQYRDQDRSGLNIQVFPAARPGFMDGGLTSGMPTGVGQGEVQFDTQGRRS